MNGSNVFFFVMNGNVRAVGNDELCVTLNSPPAAVTKWLDRGRRDNCYLCLNASTRYVTSDDGFCSTLTIN